MKIADLSYGSLIVEYGRKGWPWFSKPFDLNFGVLRSATPIPDAWNDTFFCCWNSPLGKCSFFFTGNSIPGVYPLQHPKRKAGTAIIADGYWRSAYKAGTYHGKPALLQVGVMGYWRDADLDMVAEGFGVPSEIGINGTHLHYGSGATVGGDSEGCMNADRTPLSIMALLLVEQAAAGHGEKISVGVLRES